jgi:MFS transporter, Spinster family, sphingosine-1-phosphate transporter
MTGSGIASRMPPIERDGYYAWYVAVVMAVCQAMSFVDRQLINLLVMPIKVDFGLTDTAVSLLVGLACSSALVLFALPLGWLIDRGHRCRIILACGLGWSLFSMAGGLAHGYYGLFVSRFGVGAAEAGIYAACSAIVAAYFSPARLTRAMSISSLGPFIGGGLSLIFGGLVIGMFQDLGPVRVPLAGALHPWQLTLIAVSFVGIFPVLLILTVREPRRDTGASARRTAVTWSAVFVYLRRHGRFYGWFFASVAPHLMAIYAIPAWAPAMLIRQFGVPIAIVGVRLGAMSLLAGVGGTLAAPYVARFLGRGDVGMGAVRGMQCGVLATAALCVMLPFVASATAMMGLVGAIVFATTLPLPLASATLVGTTPDQFRGRIGSIYFLMSGLTGLALAPTLVGIVTEHVLQDPGKIATSLALVLGTAGIVSSGLMLRLPGAFRLVRDDMDPVPA